MAPLTVTGCGEDVVWFCTERNKDNAAMTQADQEGCAHVWTQYGKSNKRKADGSELRKYLCQGCRTLKNTKATKQEHEDKEIPYRRLILNSDGTGQWVEHDEVGVHFCKPRTATELMGKEVFAKHVEGIKAGSVKLPPTKSLTNLETAYSRIFSDLGEDGIAEARDGGFPNREAALKKIRRVISKKYPKIPNLESLNLPEFEEVSFTLRSSKNEESDLYKEKLLQLAEENIAIFASKAQLKLLASCKYIFSDGTFKTRPNGSYQVYRTCGTMVNAETGEYLILPLVTAIMKRKDSVTYHHYWDAVQNMICSAQELDEAQIKWSVAMFDCEPASFQTFATVFPGVSPHLCAFHVKQALNERVGKIGLQVPYKEDPCVQKCVRMIGALQLIDKDLWETACDVIENHIELEFLDGPHKDTLLDLLTYFRDQWFKYGAYFSLWKLAKEAPRTNNACEIYHAHIKRYFTQGAYLGQWIHQFRVVQNAEQNYCMDLLRGKPVKHRFAAFYANIADQLDQCKDELKSAILDESGEVFLRGQISRFLSKTGKLLGIKPTNVDRAQDVSLASENDDDIGSQTPIEIRDESDLAELDSFLSAE